MSHVASECSVCLDQEREERLGHAPARRERIAAAALGGLLAAPGTNGPNGEYLYPIQSIFPELAVKWADALIAELDK